MEGLAGAVTARRVEEARMRAGTALVYLCTSQGENRMPLFATSRCQKMSWHVSFLLNNDIFTAPLPAQGHACKDESCMLSSRHPIASASSGPTQLQTLRTGTPAHQDREHASTYTATFGDKEML